MASVFVRLIGVLSLLLALAPQARADDAKPQKLRVYVGTYTNNTKSEGIYLLELDLKTGSLTSKGLAGAAVDPSFLAFAPSKKYLYAVNEVGNFGGKKAGAVSAFAVDAALGKLTLLNQQSSGGAAPCHLVVDGEGRNVLVANYSGGSVACLPIGSDGKLNEASSFVQHEGTSVNKRRQEAPHAHSINLDPAGRFAFAADLGTDKVHIYRFDAAKGTLTPNDPPSAPVAPGSGPRHFAFHPSGKYAYVINELLSTVTAFSYDATKGTLTEVQTISTLPEDFKGSSGTAEVVVHPSGTFLYGSNRGHDSLAVFGLNPETGRLTGKGHAHCLGIKTPRNFAVDPSGTYVLAAHQSANKVEVFRIDAKNGELTPTGSSVEVPAPVCLKMVPAPQP